VHPEISVVDHLEVKASIAIDDAGEITGIAWPFGSPDSVGDMIRKGAFHLVADDLPMLLAHDPEQPIGIWSEINETAEGLTVKGKLFVDESKRALAVRSMIKSGLITGLSIGFRTKSATKQGRNRIISALDLLEISVVRNPAHPRARIAHAKDATAAIAEAITRAAVALRNH
jgi:HK97 family phage prohead protease